LNFTIGGNGQVTTSEAVSEQHDLSPALLSCIGDAVRRWTFPAPEGGQPAVVRTVISLAGTPAASTPTASNAALPTATADEFVVTRMHYRYGSGGLREDLVFRAATPVVGGREEFTQGTPQSQGATPSAVNNFQARYAIRHAWEGAIACEHPIRNQWGGPPVGQPNVAVAPSHGPRTPVQLDAMLVSSLGPIGSGAPTNTAAAAHTASTPTPTTNAPTPTAAPSAAPSGGLCAVQLGTAPRDEPANTVPLGITAAFGALALVMRTRRR